MQINERINLKSHDICVKEEHTVPRCATMCSSPRKGMAARFRMWGEHFEKPADMASPSKVCTVSGEYAVATSHREGGNEEEGGELKTQTLEL